ncbi:uncharacterized protein PSFLO_04732 [Pseudozyma flocculosa]|uniref:Uncharacterized protein n=1 Tax=Pseudozyma flocculosa TaxID=84751 RepID=A0A5C3F4I0_9BASI|nr:uncharacterized protein PSFLO_04732 [Pseudozyma flocculosa]
MSSPLAVSAGTFVRWQSRAEKRRLERMSRRGWVVLRESEDRTHAGRPPKPWPGQARQAVVPLRATKAADQALDPTRTPTGALVLPDLVPPPPPPPQCFSCTRLAAVVVPYDDVGQDTSGQPGPFSGRTSAARIWTDGPTDRPTSGKIGWPIVWPALILTSYDSSKVASPTHSSSTASTPYVSGGPSLASLGSDDDDDDDDDDNSAPASSDVVLPVAVPDAHSVSRIASSSGNGHAGEYRSAHGTEAVPTHAGVPQEAILGREAASRAGNQIRPPWSKSWPGGLRRRVGTGRMAGQACLHLFSLPMQPKGKGTTESRRKLSWPFDGGRSMSAMHTLDDSCSVVTEGEWGAGYRVPLQRLISDTSNLRAPIIRHHHRNRLASDPRVELGYRQQLATLLPMEEKAGKSRALTFPLSCSRLLA